MIGQAQNGASRYLRSISVSNHSLNRLVSQLSIRNPSSLSLLDYRCVWKKRRVGRTMEEGPMEEF